MSANSLFSPLAPRTGLTLRNRVVMVPMTTWAGNSDLTVVG